MEAVRKAIARALEKGDTQDRAFREKVYRQTFAALDRSLQARSDLSADQVQQQREQVKAVIVEIERGFRGQAAPEAPVHQAPPPETAPSESESDFVPRVERGDRLNGAEETDRYYAPDDVRGFAEAPARRRPYGLFLVAAILVAAIGIGAWWVVQTGLWRVGDADPSEPDPPAQELNGSGAPASLTGGDSDWITIFSPGDPTSVTAPAGTAAQVMDNGEGTFLRLAGETGDAPVSFDIGQGVLERLAGQRAVFSLTARAAEGEETQISVSCNLGSLGGCGRTRYIVGNQPTEQLFEVEVPQGSPDDGGTIAIVPDVEGQGRALDVFSLRVSAPD